MKSEYLTLIKKFKKRKVLVVGDFILDAYLRGSCSRLAPEAPVPVVDITEKKYCLGGSANAAANLSSLGAEVFYCTVIGEDIAATQALNLLAECGVNTELVVCNPKRHTIVKTRITAPAQTLVRLDEGSETQIDTAAETKLFIICIRPTLNATPY